MQQIKITESVAARRRIPFACEDASGAPVTGATFVSNELLLSKNGASAVAFAGTVIEEGAGAYWYEATQTEVNTFGMLMMRTNKTGIVAHKFVVQIVNHDPYGSVVADVVSIGQSTAALQVLKAMYLSCPTGAVEVTPVAPSNGGGVCVFQAVMDAGWGEITANHMNGRAVLFTSGVMKGSTVRIDDYAWDAVNTQSIFTCSEAQETPVDGCTFVVV